MDETRELLKANFNRLEGLIGEVRELRYKIKDVQGDVEALRAKMAGDGHQPESTGGRGEGGRAEARGESGANAGESGHEAQSGGPGGGGRGFEAGREVGSDSGGRGAFGGQGHGTEGGAHVAGGGCGHGAGRGSAQCGGGRDAHGGGGREDDLLARLERIEERLHYLGVKWLELDEKVFRLERRGR